MMLYNLSLKSAEYNVKKVVKFVWISLVFLLVIFNQFSCKNNKKPVFKDEVTSDSNGVIDDLVKGKIGYNIPEVMEVGENYSGIVTISKALNDSILFKNLEESDFKKKQITISSRVKVILLDPTNGKNFSITPLNTEEQLVDAITNTVWRWNVEPIKTGENQLILRTTVKIKDRLGVSYKDVEVFEKNIKVETTMSKQISGFFIEYWQFLLTVIILPFGIWVFNFLKAKRRTNMEHD